MYEYKNVVVSNTGLGNPNDGEMTNCIDHVIVYPVLEGSIHGIRVYRNPSVSTKCKDYH